MSASSKKSISHSRWGGDIGTWVARTAATGCIRMDVKPSKRLSWPSRPDQTKYDCSELTEIDSEIMSSVAETVRHFSTPRVEFSDFDSIKAIADAFYGTTRQTEARLISYIERKFDALAKAQEKRFDEMADKASNKLESLFSSMLQALNGAGVEKTPGVCGGSARISKTRIPIWTLESARRGGAKDVELLSAYPSLTAQDLVNAWCYVRQNPTEIEKDIFENEGDG